MTVLQSPRRVQRVRHELRRRDVEVARVERLSANFASVCFAGDELADFVSLSFDDHVKFIVDGSEGQPSGDGQPIRRDYTPRRFDAERCELTIEFALHGHGLASEWARHAAPGQRAAIGGPRGSMIVPADFDWHLLAGDATALPAIHRRLDELPSGSRAIVLLQADDADRRRFDSAADVQAQWVHGPADWLSSLRGLQLPGGEGFAWCAGEAHLMADAREALLSHHGHPREAMRVAAYWKRGADAFHETLEG